MLAELFTAGLSKPHNVVSQAFPLSELGRGSCDRYAASQTTSTSSSDEDENRKTELVWAAICVSNALVKGEILQP